MSNRVRQVDRISAWLHQHDGLCAMAPLDWHPPIVRVAARIFDLKEMGVAIQATHRCPIHNNADHAYYRLNSMGRLF